MLAQLRTATRPLHDRLDSLPSLKRLLAADLTRDEYATILETFYGIHRPLEDAIHDFVAQHSWESNLEERRKSAFLAADLSFLGRDPTRVVLASDIPICEEPGDAWGLLYVLEGSRLGALVISRQLRRSLQLEGDGLQFFQAGAPRSAQDWVIFCTALEKWAASQARHDRVITAACAGFQAFENWLKPRTGSEVLS